MLERCAQGRRGWGISLRSRRLVILVAISALALLAAAQGILAGGTSVVAVSTSVPLGGSGSTTIEVHNLPPTGLAAWTIDVSYDPGLVSVVSCSPTNGGACNTAFGSNVVRIAGSSAGGLFGDAVLATITFACGQQTGTGALTPSISVLNDATPGKLLPISATTQTGSVACVVPPPTATRPPSQAPTATRPQPTSPAGNPTTRPGATARAPTAGAPGTSAGTPATGTQPAEATPGAPTATPVSGVAGAVRPASPSAPTGQDPAQRPEAAPPAASVRPHTSSILASPGQLSTSMQVIVTNIILAIILLIVLFFTSTLFNGTLDENRAEIERYVARFTAPFGRAAHAAQGAVKSFGGGALLVESAVAPVALLGLTGLIYSFDEPSWGLNSKSLVLFLSVVIAVGMSTIIYEGGEALVHRARHGVPAGIRLFPTAIAIAAAFVALSRLAQFEAPVMFGFIAASAVFVPVALDHRQTGIAVFVPAVTLLVLSLVSWSLMGPLRDASNDSHTWWAVLPGETAAMLFVSGIEGLLFCLIPLQFLDGWKIIRWNPAVWAVLIGIPAFLFAWVILNPAAAGFDALLEGRVLTIIALVAAYSAVTVVIWAYFFLQHRRRQAALA